MLQGSTVTYYKTEQVPVPSRCLCTLRSPRSLVHALALSLQDKSARGKIKLKKARVYVTTRHTGKVYGGTHAHATALNNVSSTGGREAY